MSSRLSTSDRNVYAIKTTVFPKDSKQMGLFFKSCNM